MDRSKFFRNSSTPIAYMFQYGVVIPFLIRILIRMRRTRTTLLVDNIRIGVTERVVSKRIQQCISRYLKIVHNIKHPFAYIEITVHMQNQPFSGSFVIPPRKLCLWWVYCFHVVRLCIHASVRVPIAFLLNISPPKPLDGATSNFVPRHVTCCRGYWAIFRITLTPKSRSKVR